MARARHLAVFHDTFIDDLQFWVASDRNVASKILKLVKSVQSDPFDGIGKPEPLKHDLKGAWSRRITERDRLVYYVHSDRIEFLQARFHY